MSTGTWAEVRDPFAQLPALVFRRAPSPPHPFEWVAGACEEIAGRPAEALTGDVAVWWERVPADPCGRALAAILEARTRRGAYCAIYPYTSPAGVRRVLREEARAVRAADGAVAGFEGVIVDVSARERELLELRESEARFRALTEHAASFLIEVTADGDALYVSPRLTEVMGYREEELVGTSLLDLVLDPADRERVERVRVASASDMAPAELLVRCRHRDGSWRWLELAIRPFMTEAGELRGSVVGRDVTERELAGHKLQQQLVGERRIADLAQHLLTLGYGDPEAGIERTLETAGALAAADRVRFTAIDSRGRVAAESQWTAPGIAPSTMGALLCSEGSLRGTPWTARRLAGREVVHVPDAEALPAEAASERAALATDGVLAHLAIPVVAGERIAGILDFSRLSQARGWDEPEVTRLRLIAEVLASALRGRQAEVARVENEQRFRALTEHAGDAICEASVYGEIFYVSPMFEELFGYSQENLGELAEENLVHPDDTPVLAEMRERFDRDRSFGSLRLRIRHRDGSWRWIEVTARGFLSGAQERRVAVVVRDVSEREEVRTRLEEQLALESRVAELARRFLALGADQIDTGIRESLAVVGPLVEADRAWLFAFRNFARTGPDVYEWSRQGVEASAERMRDADRLRFPWSYRFLAAGEVIHVPDAGELPDEAKAERDEMQGRGVRSMLGIPLRFGDLLVGYLGLETLHAAKSWSPESVTILRLVGEILMSALRRKRAEEELVESQIQLLQAQKMEAVGTLAGGIAHDFNNQLTVMLGNARYVQARMGADSNLADAMLDLTRSAEHCAQLTRSLLAFSRRSAVSPRSLDVREVVSETRELIEPLIPSSIELAVVLGDDVAPASADPIQLQQVLLNLVLNARDALPDGGTIAITTANRSVDDAEAVRAGLRVPGSYVEIAVEDDGIGMDDETRSRVFEPFFTTKPLGEGTGLGLATAYGVVQESGGAISLESALGRGTRVRVLLPRGAVAPSAEQAVLRTRPVEGDETLLLVEDEPSVRRFVVRALEERGYTVIEARDGESGLRLGRRCVEEIDALVTDLDMPGLDGLDLARQLRSARPELPVLLLSGHASNHPLSRREQLEGARFLQKPFSEDAVLAEVRELLDESGGVIR